MKKDHVAVPEPSSRFNTIECNECDEAQVVYSHATTPVSCNSCGNPLTTSTGSKARINGRIIRAADVVAT